MTSEPVPILESTDATYSSDYPSFLFALSMVKIEINWLQKQHKFITESVETSGPLVVHVQAAMPSSPCCVPRVSAGEKSQGAKACVTFPHLFPSREFHFPWGWRLGASVQVLRSLQSTWGHLWNTGGGSRASPETEVSRAQLLAVQ